MTTVSRTMTTVSDENEPHSEALRSALAVMKRSSDNNEVGRLAFKVVTEALTNLNEALAMHRVTIATYENQVADMPTSHRDTRNSGLWITHRARLKTLLL